MRRTTRKVALALALACVVAGVCASSAAVAGRQAEVRLPSTPLKFGVFIARFDAAGTFKLEGDRWPTLSGNWKSAGDEIEFSMSGGPERLRRPRAIPARVEGKPRQLRPRLG